MAMEENSTNPEYVMPKQNENQLETLCTFCLRKPTTQWMEITVTAETI